MSYGGRDSSPIGHLHCGGQGMRKVRDYTEVLQLFEEVQQQGLEPNVITYTTVIGAGKLTLQFFDEMRQQGL